MCVCVCIKVGHVFIAFNCIFAKDRQFGLSVLPDKSNRSTQANWWEANKNTEY